MAKQKSVFGTSKRIRLGIWGLGRGLSFYSAARALNYDIVAGCDYNQHMRDNFLRLNPGAVATADAKEFLAMDFDAVLLATFCPAHADDAIACVRAGKHVLSEVTSFHTMAEGVRLVEEVEKAGKVYNLAENYPFSAANMWLARRWREGLFGDLMYGEYEYVHECRTLAYTYIDGKPIVPGNQTHSWRSWLNFHYYNTHSLGPMMHITGLRPTRVVALPTSVTLAGYLMNARDGMGGATPSLINMSNGSVVRNLMGATTNDSHNQRLWGTLGSAEIGHGGLTLRLGASGGGPVQQVIPHWDDLGELAIKSGHGGGDFWVLYYFAREILTGEPAPFDVYGGSDCTIPGILAFRSSVENGKPYDVPDLRDPKQRDAWRNDHFDQTRFDARDGLFPKDQDTRITEQFSLTMRDLITTSTAYRAYADWKRVLPDMANPTAIEGMLTKLIGIAPRLLEVEKTARQIIARYPDSTGARVLSEMLALCDPAIFKSRNFAKDLEKERAKLLKAADAILAKRAKDAEKAALVKGDIWKSPFVTRWQLSPLQARPIGGLDALKPVKPAANWKPLVASTSGGVPGFANVHDHHGDRDGIACLATTVNAPVKGVWDLLLGHDGGVKVWVDGKQVLCVPKRVNPCRPDRSSARLPLAKGKHTIVIALDTDSGGGWGVTLRFAVPKANQKKTAKPVFPAFA